MPERAKKGDKVQIHYTGRLEDGQVFDSSEGLEPLEFEVGLGQVIKGLDEGVVEMDVGERKEIHIDAGDGYGDRKEGLVQQISRREFNLKVKPYVGMSIELRLPDGNAFPVSITAITSDSITLDANHPLAGRNLIFAVERVA